VAALLVFFFACVEFLALRAVDEEDLLPLPAPALDGDNF